MLIGAGYDAYVIVGMAPSYIRLKDQSHMECILIDKDNNNDVSKPWSVDVTVKDYCPGSKRKDGLGLHCWVLLKPGRRDLDRGPCFVEPSTGILYPLDETAPYNEVWCAFNDKNYWINISHDEAPVEDFSSWLQVLPSNAPFSYVARLEIPSNLFALRHPPSGRKCLLLDKAKIEYFGQSVDPQNVLTRITLFEDRERTVVVQIVELFSPNTRSDHLIERTRNPLEMSCHEKYSVKNPESICERHETASRRSITFHPKTRSDGLLERVEDIGTSIAETFRDRPDLLIRREVCLKRLPHNTKKTNQGDVVSCGAGIGFAEIVCIDDHFEKPNDKSTITTSVATRSYQLKEKRIVVTFHCHHEALQSHDIYNKEEILDSDSKGYHLLKLESSSILAMKKTHDEMLAMREAAYKRELKLSHSAMAKPQEENLNIPKMIAEEDVAQKEESEKEFDYLSPYLAQLDNPNSPLSREDAAQVREACLRGLKERLMERANIMQNRLDMAREQLGRKQEAFQKKRRTLDEQQAFEVEVTDDTFRIKVMEKRLSEHEDTAIAKYKVSFMEQYSLTCCA
jgi:hypothetical protein